MSGKYDDILHLPHPRCPHRAPMSQRDRAAQFAPFAALTGFEDMILEDGRYTREQAEPDADAVEALNRTLLQLKALSRPLVDIRYFCPDAKKAGGAYREIRGRLKKIDSLNGCLLLEEGQKIPLEALESIHCEELDKKAEPS